MSLVRAVITSALLLVSISSASRPNCSSRLNCSGHESCLAGDDCLGHSCSNETHCKSWESCCYGICSKHCIPFNVDIIVASILGALILLCACSLCFCLICRPHSRSPAHYERMVIGQGVSAKTFTTRCLTQGDMPYLTEAVPGYPPQCLEYTQYKHEAAPPYSLIKPWRAGAVYASQNT